jgi:DNA-directed RNA polymerase specialized sigma24 family protein
MTSNDALTGRAEHSANRLIDENLIKAIASGSEAAMRTLYRRHHLPVYRFIVRFGLDPDCAENLVSEVFLEVWRRASTFEFRSQVSTWILAIARFKSLTTLGRRREESRPRKSGQDDRWSFCLTAGTLCPSNREIR